MSSTNVEDMKRHTKVYVRVGWTLLVLTVVTVMASYAPFVVPLAVTVALIIAIGKGSLVTSFFMHLISEKKLIYWTLLATVVCFLALIFLPLLGLADRVGRLTQ